MEKVSTQKKTKSKNQKPPMYMVFFHNDDYTTMEFVILILVEVFQKTLLEAQKLTIEIHTKGIALVGIYTYEIAHTRVAKVEKLAENCGYPFLATIEETLPE